MKFTKLMLSILRTDDLVDMCLDFRGGNAAVFFEELPAGRGETVANLGLEPWGEGDVCIWVGHAVLGERMYK